MTKSIPGVNLFAAGAVTVAVASLARRRERHKCPSGDLDSQLGFFACMGNIEYLISAILQIIY